MTRESKEDTHESVDMVCRPTSCLSARKEQEEEEESTREEEAKEEGESMNTSSLTGRASE